MEALEQKPKRFEIEMLIEPFGKQRPRATKMGRVYTPAQTRLKEDEIRYWLAQAKPPLFEGPVTLEMDAYFQRPKSAKKRVWHTVKPDCSNVVKTVEDAANGILWLDDKQIISMTVRKHYGDVSKIVVRVEEVA